MLWPNTLSPIPKREGRQSSSIREGFPTTSRPLHVHFMPSPPIITGKDVPLYIIIYKNVPVDITALTYGT